MHESRQVPHQHGHRPLGRLVSAGLDVYSASDRERVAIKKRAYQYTRSKEGQGQQWNTP